MATSTKALELIKQCNDNRNPELDLSDCQLQEIPQEIKDFYWLKKLYINNNQIEVISNLEKLVNLEELKINSNKISKIQGLETLSQLTFLDLYENQIEIIQNLENLSELKFLGFPNNNISKIQGLSHLKKLSKLWLDSNQIQNIEGLDTLENLTVLGLRNNRITNIVGLQKLIKLDILSLAENFIYSIENLQNLVQLNILYLWGNNIKKIEGLDKLVNISILYLSNNQIEKIEGLHKLVNIKELYLDENRIKEIEGLNKLKKLSILILAKNNISRIENLSNLKTINILNINENQINKIEGLKDLKKLSILALGINSISKIEGFDNLVNIRELYLQGNKIKKIENLTHLKNLSILYFNSNLILKIEGIDSLENLSELHLKKNDISEESLLSTDIFSIEKLKTLTLEGNPIKSLPIESLNNLKAIIGYIESKQEQQVPNKFLKVNIIGEGRIGKTQLFHFFEGESYVPNEDETHGTNTFLYKIPKHDYHAQIWDFGGQSYHHGFHQVFIRPKDFNLVLWCNEDSQNPNYSYWLGSARNYSSKAPLLLVQNVWTETDDLKNKSAFIPHTSIYPNNEKLQIYEVGFESIFSINIKALHQKDSKWKIKHEYFLNSLYQAIIDYTQQIETFKEIPQKWLKIKKNLDANPFQDLYLTKDKFKKRYAKDLDDTNFEILLFYLEFTGNILYFNDNNWLHEYVFPNPPKLSDWIYKDILNREFKKTNVGVLNFKELIKNIGEEKAWIIREIMTGFNLLFEEKDNDNNLVIPQFLPEQNNTFKDYLLDLIPYSFCIRFSDFIHESRIFQFISEYGEYANDTTSYWCYGIIFTKDKIKTLVYYENMSRTIYVHIEDKNGRIKIAQEIFDFFIFKQEKRNQVGTRLSLYAKNKGLTLKEIFDYLESKGTLIERNPNTKIPKILELELDKHFSDNISAKKIRPVFISHSVGNGMSRTMESIIGVAMKYLEKREVSIERIIEGVQLSTNRSNYFDVKETIKYNNEGLNIGICITTKEKIKLDYLAINLLGMENHKLPKVFISYNRKDLEFKDELKSHLSILERYDLLKAWTCDKIKAGKWDKQIQTELEEADIIIYMISHNFMSSEYIMEKEVKKGIQLAEQNPNKKIICILVGECMWSSWDFLEEKFNAIKGKNDTFSESMNLSQFQFLPYHQYKNNLGVAVKEEIVALEQWGRNHYEVRNVAFKQIVSKILNEIK